MTLICFTATGYKSQEFRVFEQDGRPDLNPGFLVSSASRLLTCKQELQTYTCQAEHIAAASALLHHVFIASCGCC